MATQDVQISDLTQVNTPATTDLLLIRHGTVDSKITYSDIKSAINTNTLYASSDGVVTDQANQYYNRSQVDAKVTNLQNQIDTLNSNPYGKYVGIYLINDNLNDCITNGRYVCHSSSYATSANNYPENVGGYLDVIARDGNNQVWQFYTSFTPKKYYRIRNAIASGGVWSTWKEG